MRLSARPHPAMALPAVLALSACVSAPQPAPSPVFFRVPVQEAAAVQALAREQERQVRSCPAGPSCIRARYLRGLAALYEDRSVARKEFQAVLAAAPDGPYAISSRQWLLLLDGGEGASDREATFSQAMERVVREVLEGEAAIRRATREVRAPAPAAATKKDAQAVQSLRQQLKKRERQIEVLTRQIEALKRVDQEVREQVKPGRRAE